MDINLPEALESDFREALACLEANAPNASAMMCRRLVSRLAVTNGADTEATTGPQLDFLKKRHIIGDDVYQAAKLVKVLGDEGAHPPDEVTMDEARQAVSATKEILEALKSGGPEGR